MNHLVPCPECSRHVRVTETECPFCALPLDLAGTPEAQLPKIRLGRAATFAFGATLASATALAACAGKAEESSGSRGGTGGSAAGRGGTSTGGGGTSAGTSSEGGFTVAPPYGLPPPPPPTAGSTGSGGNDGSGSGGYGLLYGAPPSEDAGNAAGDSGNGVPLYGGPPR